MGERPVRKKEKNDTGGGRGGGFLDIKIGMKIGGFPVFVCHSCALSAGRFPPDPPLTSFFLILEAPIQEARTSAFFSNSRF